MNRFLLLAVTILLLTGLLGPSPAATPVTPDVQDRSPGLGIAVTPRNFPAHTMADIDQAFGMAKELGDYAVFIYQWKDVDLQVVRLMLQKSRDVGLIPILGLSPTTLDQDRKEIDLPASVRAKAGPFVSFANPVIREAFKKSAAELARLRPQYLCLATEINFLALQRLPEYLHFASLYKEAYREVKRISPATKVFVSFQWEWVRILDAKELDKIKEHSKVIDIFRPELDVVGFTTYPAPFHGSPVELPDDYYTWMYNHIKKSDEVLFMEVGWPTSGPGSDPEQVLFIERLPQLMQGINDKIIAWALLHDVSIPQFGADLNTVGLVRSNGERKAGYMTFQELKQSLK
ncbi:MAG: hypothetical protein ACREIS_10275 [Nitrospiraceae bacterium]